VRIFILAGTEDGRLLADVLKKQGYDILVSALTAYGADLAREYGLPARYGAIDDQTLAAILQEGNFAALIDATHPYAVSVKELAKRVCQELSIPYVRWQRSSLEIESHPLIHWAKNIPEAAQIAAGLGQRILLTTGSNALPEWTAQPCFKNKNLYVRVLPTSQVLGRCEALGFKPNQIIAAQGPFSQEWDEAMFKQLKIEVVVAKESGKIGGTPEKVQSCLNLKIPLVLLERPKTEEDVPNQRNDSIACLLKKLEELT
jgi:precorrin-6A/cobalt-precorrin-6A reductase